MRKKFECRSVIIKECHPFNDDFRKLYLIFRLTICPGMSERMFEAYYKSGTLEYIDVSFFYAATDEIAGFCAAAFYTTDIGGKTITIARSATGMLPEYRSKSLNKWVLYKKYMLYKWHHPFRKLILTIYASNPFIYSMVCKYTGIVYPRDGQQIPDSIMAIKNEILEGNNLRKRESEPFVVRINFEVAKSEQLKTQAVKSKNRHVQFFVSKTGLQHCKTLLLIIPVSFINIFMCIGLMSGYFIINKIHFPQINLLQTFRKKENRYNLLARFFTVRKRNYANRKGM